VCVSICSSVWPFCFVVEKLTEKNRSKSKWPINQAKRDGSFAFSVQTVRSKWGSTKVRRKANKHLHSSWLVSNLKINLGHSFGSTRLLSARLSRSPSLIAINKPPSTSERRPLDAIRDHWTPFHLVSLELFPITWFR